jgi:3',5'-cyclic AMP phosphodiesterase CpdA
VQDGHLVTLPNHGKAIFVSDLEGDVAKLALLIDQYDLIDAWRRDEPIFLCVLGDMVDRSTTGSLLVEFLLELKVREGFSRQVIILPGNHELSLEMNFQKTKNYRSDEPSLLGDISEGSIPVEPTRRVGKTLSRCFMNFALTRR